MTKKIFIMGYYGSHNIGDELILESTIGLARQQFKEAEIRVLTYSIKETEQRFGVIGVSRNDFSGILKAICWCDVTIGGGGSMLQNASSNRSLIYYLSILFVAKLYQKKVLLLGNGFGPVRGGFYKALTLWILGGVTDVVLRDIESYELLKKEGLTNISYGADLAFNLQIHSETSVPHKRILLNLRPWKTHITAEEWVPRFITYWESKGYEVALLSMQTGMDDVLLQKFVTETVPLYRAENGQALISWLKESDVVVAMRLHTLIFSAIAKTPFVGIGYDPKVISFVSDLGQVLACKTESLTLEAINLAVKRTIDTREERLKALHQKAESLKERIGKNPKALEKLN